MAQAKKHYSTKYTYTISYTDKRGTLPAKTSVAKSLSVENDAYLVKTIWCDSVKLSV